MYVRHPRTLRDYTLASTFLHDNRTVTIYFPPGYNELLSYPVIYAQDGQDFLFLGRAATIAGHLILEEGAEPYLMVCIHVDKKHRSSEYAPGGEQFDAYCRFVAEELVPFIEQETAARRSPESRIVLGDSLGGTVSLHLALRYPDLFQKAVLLSGAVFEPTRSAIAASGLLGHLSIQMVVGTEETAVRTQWGTIDFVSENRLTRDMLQQKNARLSYTEKPGRHVWGFWQQELPDMLLQIL